MKFSLLILVLCVTACGPVSNSPATPASGSPSAESTAKVLVSKQAYLDFLACTKKSETASEHQATIQTGIDNVTAIPDAAWETIKTNLSISAKDFVARYPSCANQ
jgi:hypothetical protein